MARVAVWTEPGRSCVGVVAAIDTLAAISSETAIPNPTDLAMAR
jgi:hypothetical protein